LDVNFFEDLPDFLTPNDNFVEPVDLAAIISFI
jgi:hypothetical protein